MSLEDGAETLLVSDNRLHLNPRWSPDGQFLAYSRFEYRPELNKRSGPVVLRNMASGEEQLLTSAPTPHRDYIYDWSPDGRWVIGSTDRLTPDRWVIALFPLSAAPRAEMEMRVVRSSPDQNLWAPRFSPDGRWICYLAQLPAAATSEIYAISESGGDPVRITEENSWADKPRWSPDGNILYFISNRHSIFLNVWGIGFDPVKGSPAGQPFQVTDFENPARMLSPRVSHLEMSLDETRLALPIQETSGDIWVLENVGR